MRGRVRFPSSRDVIVSSLTREIFRHVAAAIIISFSSILACVLVSAVFPLGPDEPLLPFSFAHASALSSVTSSSSSSPEDQINAAYDVIARLLGPVAAARFDFILTPLSVDDGGASAAAGSGSPYSHDSFEIFAELPQTNANGDNDDHNNKDKPISANGFAKSVHVTATSGVALCAGAYQYLKQALGVVVTWGEDASGTQIETALRYVAANAPWPAFSLKRTTLTPLRYNWNMCTFSYTAVWWNETRWQKEVDWMALHGVNMPLAVAGVEYVWHKAYVEKLKVPLETLQEWFSGPAFLTWQRMGNVRGFGGPLSLQWINRQKDLNVFILKEMRALGMRPVLSCFAGHVPEVAKTLFPEDTDRFHRSERWMGFPDAFTGVWHLEPTAKAYQVIGEAFMTAQRDAYGDADFFNCDTFNEVDPKSSEKDALAAASRAVVSAIRSVQPSGVWVMQGWLFFFSKFWQEKVRIQHYLSGAAVDEMIILDLISESATVAEHNVDANHEYYGKRWIYNMLHNFGGVHDIYGDVAAIYNRVPKKIANKEWKNCIGLGMTAEAVEHNSFVYEAFTDLYFQNHLSPIGLSVAGGGGDEQKQQQQKGGGGGNRENAPPAIKSNAVNNQPKGAAAAAAGYILPEGDRFVTLDEWAHRFGLQRHGAFDPSTEGILKAFGLTADELFELQSASSELSKIFAQEFHTHQHGGSFIRSFLDHHPHSPPRRVEPFTRSTLRSFLPSIHALKLAFRIARLTDKIVFNENELVEPTSSSYNSNYGINNYRRRRIVRDGGAGGEGNSHSSSADAASPNYNDPTVKNAKVHRPIHTDMIDLVGVLAHGFYELTYDCFAQLTMLKMDDGEKLKAGEGSRTIKYHRTLHGARMLGKTLIRMYHALDSIMGSNPNYLLGRWIHTARQLALDLGPTNQQLLDDPATDPAVKALFTHERLPKEANLYDYNARNIVTVWGPKSGMRLEGYARRMWSGLFRDVYAMRQRFVYTIYSRSARQQARELRREAEEKEKEKKENSNNNDASPDSKFRSEQPIFNTMRQAFEQLRGRTDLWVSNGASAPQQYSPYATAPTVTVIEREARQGEEAVNKSSSPSSAAKTRILSTKRRDTTSLSRQFLKNIVLLPQRELKEYFAVLEGGAAGSVLAEEYDGNPSLLSAGGNGEEAASSSASASRQSSMMVTISPLSDHRTSAISMRTIAKIEVPPKHIAAFVPFMASLCLRSIGPSCLGFDAARGILFVRALLTEEELRAEDDAEEKADAAEEKRKQSAADGGQHEEDEGPKLSRLPRGIRLVFEPSSAADSEKVAKGGHGDIYVRREATQRRTHL